MTRPFDDPLYLDGVGAILAGTANVVMQLALAPVGHGVLESRVESGQVTRHPLKRFRTTFSYLAVALLGTEEDRAQYRAAVDSVHRLVRSDADAPVRYNAFDPDLQLWVAACLYYGTVDVYAKLHGGVPESIADALYAHAARFGTTLQVRPDMWPPDRDAFERYWHDASARVSIDEPVRHYLLDLMANRHLPGHLGGRLNTWVSTGFLPPRFRDELRLPWSAADQARFDRAMRRVGAVSRRLPTAVRRFPFTYLLWDVRRRVRRGRPLV